MADFSCTDINGIDVSQFVFNDDGTVSGIISTGSTTTDPNTNPGGTTFPPSLPTGKSQLPPPTSPNPHQPPYSPAAGTTLSPISEECCSALSFTWEPSSNTCYWSDACGLDTDIKLVLGAKGNEGAWFQVDENESCHLEVEFDYLFQYGCDALMGCQTDDLSCLDILQGLDVCVTLEHMVPQELPNGNTNLSGQTSFVNAEGLNTVYEEQIFKIDNIVDFLDGNCSTGIYVTGGTACMDRLTQCLSYELSGDCGVLSACTLDSNWLHHKFVISDLAILSGLTNEKVKIGFNIKNCECDFSLLIDRIEINKVCTARDREDIYVSKCPGFELERVCDNKKSWVAEETKQEREHDLSMRITDYDINHHKLGINTKEVDLDISPANAIETDIWAYIKDNPSLLGCSTGATGTTSVVCATDINFSGILEAQASGCTSEALSGCSVDSQWGITATLGCDVFYTNDNFYVSSGLTDTPTQTEYLNELTNIGNTLGLDMITGATNITFTGPIDCEGVIFINKNFKIDLSLVVTTNCDIKLFQDGDEFLFQDGTNYDFN